MQSSVTDNPELNIASSASEKEQGSGLPITQNDNFHTITGSYRWSDDGEFLVTQIGDELHFIDHKNNDIKTLTFEPSEPEYDCFLRWNDNMVFVATVNTLLPTETRIIKQGENYVINNARIYKMDGTLVKDFPLVEDVNLVYKSEEVFESSVRQNLDRVLWIDDDTIAINTQSRVFLYRVSDDKLELVDDMTKEVTGGWTIYAANSFGALEDWVDNGRYYYTASRTINDKQQPQVALYTADLENGARPVLGSDWYYDRYKIRDGKLIIQNNRYGDAAEIPEPYRNLFPMLISDVSYVDLNANTWPVSIGEIFNDGSLVLNDGRYLAWHENRIDGENVERIFHCLDTESGTDTTFAPQKYESKPLTYGSWSYTLINFRVVDGSVQFIYNSNDLQETKTLAEGIITEDWLTPYYLYDTATDTRKLLSDFWCLPYENSFNAAKTHFVEAESYNSIRVCALEQIN